MDVIDRNVSSLDEDTTAAFFNVELDVFLLEDVSVLLPMVMVDHGLDFLDALITPGTETAEVTEETSDADVGTSDVPASKDDDDDDDIAIVLSSLLDDAMVATSTEVAGANDGPTCGLVPLGRFFRFLFDACVPSPLLFLSATSPMIPSPSTSSNCFNSFDRTSPHGSISNIEREQK